MAQTIAGLPNAGRSQFFNFQYEEPLSAGGGLELAREILMHDDDLELLVQCFSGRQLDMSPPINVSINSVATDANGNPVQFVGGHWGPTASPFPLQMTINIGELPMASARIKLRAPSYEGCSARRPTVRGGNARVTTLQGIHLKSGQNDTFRLLVLRGPEPEYAVESAKDLPAVEVHERHVAVMPPSHQPPMMSFGAERWRSCYTPVPRRCSLGRFDRQRV